MSLGKDLEGLSLVISHWSLREELRRMVIGHLSFVIGGEPGRAVISHLSLVIGNW